MLENFYSIITCAAVFDCYKKKIPNALILIGLLNGCFCSILRAGPSGLCKAATAALIMFLITYPIYLFHGLGAGDIKLYCVIAAYLGISMARKILFASLFIGAVLGCINLIFHSIFGRQSKTNINRKQNIEKKKSKENVIRNRKFCFAPAILIACLLVFG